MKKRIKRAVASLAVAAVCTLGATSQASALDLLDELLGGHKYADASGCGCAQKKGGHVQRCGSGCGSKGLAGPAQRGGHKVAAAHVQHSGKKGGGSKKGSYHAELCAKIKAKMDALKCKLTAHHGKGSKGKGKGSKVDTTLEYRADGAGMVPAPSINPGYQSVPVPPNPDPST